MELDRILDEMMMVEGSMERVFSVASDIGYRVSSVALRRAVVGALVECMSNLNNEDDQASLSRVCQALNGFNMGIYRRRKAIGKYRRSKRGGSGARS